MSSWLHHFNVVLLRNPQRTQESISLAMGKISKTHGINTDASLVELKSARNLDSFKKFGPRGLLQNSRISDTMMNQLGWVYMGGLVRTCMSWLEKNEGNMH